MDRKFELNTPNERDIILDDTAWPPTWQREYPSTMDNSDKTSGEVEIISTPLGRVDQNPD